MSDARSKLDILYRDILGDVSDLINRIEEIDSRIPGLGETISNQANRLESVLAGLQQGLANFAAKLDAINKANMERVRIEAEQELTSYSDKLAQDLAKEVGGIAEDIASTVELLKSAAGESAGSLSNATQALKDATRGIKDIMKAANPDWQEKRKDFALIGAVAGLVGGIVAALITSAVFLLTKPASENRPGSQVQYHQK